MLAQLYNLPTNDRKLAEFSFANSDHHTRIVSGVLKQKGISLPDYVLDPIAMFDVSNFFLRHQDIHNRQNAALGIAGNDLSFVDFKNPNQLQAWIWLHASEHLQAAQILGIP